MTTVMTVAGPSRDGRTNRWNVECPKCGHRFSPQTTRLSTQEIECPKAKCRAGMLARYNDEPPICVLMEQEK